MHCFRILMGLERRIYLPVGTVYPALTAVSRIDGQNVRSTLKILGPFPYLRIIFQ